MRLAHLWRIKHKFIKMHIMSSITLKSGCNLDYTLNQKHYHFEIIILMILSCLTTSINITVSDADVEFREGDLYRTLMHDRLPVRPAWQWSTPTNVYVEFYLGHVKELV